MSSGFVNLDEFLADIGRAETDLREELVTGVEDAVRAVALPYAVERTPRRTNRLADSADVERQGESVGIVFNAPYGRGAEAGNFGKWSGFRRYGPAGHRFAGAALEATEDKVADDVVEKMLPAFSVFGWFVG